MEAPYLILADSSFDRRLKLFDPNLYLVFDQKRQRWCVLEKALDGSGSNLLIVCEDDKGEPKPLGEWVFNTLFVWRARGEERNRNVEQFYLDERAEEDRQAKEMNKKADEIGEYFWKHEIRACQKIANLLSNLPQNDVTAGFRKIEPKSKGVII